MALVNGNFKGIVNGKTIYNYRNKLDYGIDKLDDRLNIVRDVLNLEDVNGSDFSKDEFWQEVWDMGICKTGLNRDDTLWSDTNICNTLEGMGTYLLSKHKKDPKENIKIYDSYELFKRALKEQDIISKHGEYEESSEGSEGNRNDIVVFRQKTNYKLAPKLAISNKDKKKFKEIAEYDNYKEYLLSLRNDENKREKLANKINTKISNFKCNTSGDVYRIIQKQIPSVTDDMLQVKIKKERPIQWKNPLKDSGNDIDWDCLDMLDPIHVKALLNVPKEVDIDSNINITLNELISKAALTDDQKDILALWRKDMSQQDIADTLDKSRSVVVKQLNKIVNKIIDAYEKEYAENYYYLNIVKGQYKKCSKCGENKLIQCFDKKGKQGFQSQCKDCRKS